MGAGQETPASSAPGQAGLGQRCRGPGPGSAGERLDQGTEIAFLTIIPTATQLPAAGQLTLTKAALSCGPGGGPGNGASAGSRFRRTVTRPGRGCQSSGRRRGPQPRYLSLGTKPALRPGFGWARLGAGVDQQEPRPEPGPATGGRWLAGPRSCPAQPAARRGGPATRHIPGTAAQLDAVLAVHVGGKHTCPRLRDVPDALAGSAAHRRRSVPAYFGRPPVLHLPVAARMICSPVTAASITPGPAMPSTGRPG